VPTVPFNVTSPTERYNLKDLRVIVVDTRYASAVDQNGLTLIPPTLISFAETFRSDLKELGHDIPVITSTEAEEHSLFVTISSKPHDFLDAAGRPTSEGYELHVTPNSVILTGASPLGAWWGTRTLLQQAVLGHFEFPVGDGIDAPGWGERGMMVRSRLHMNELRYQSLTLCSLMLGDITILRISSLRCVPTCRISSRTCSTYI
jgi:hexosaminidase